MSMRRWLLVEEGYWRIASTRLCLLLAVMLALVTPACSLMAVGTPVPTATEALPSPAADVSASPPPPVAPTATVPRASGSAVPPTTVAPPRGVAVPKQTPAPHGPQTLTLAGGIEAPATFDPALVRDASTAFLARQVFSGLLKLDEQLEPVPDLAAAPPVVSSDQRAYVFTLREGLLFHDGTPVTAETVKQSLERASDPRLANGDGFSLPAATYLIDIKGMAQRLKGERADVEGIRVTGPLTLEFELEAPQATFLVKLTHTTAAVVDVRQVEQRQWWKRPNATGPFRLTEWRDGDHLLFSRWEQYYAGAPHLEKIIWLLGANASQPLNLYEGGTIDITSLGVGTIDRVLVPSSPLNRDLRITPQLSLTYVAFNVKEPPFDDVRVRQAFARAIDRDKVAQVMFEGKVDKATGLVPPALPGGDLNRPTGDHAAELAEARRLLGESRYGAKLPRPRLYVTGGGLGGMLRDVYEQDLGVTVDVIAVTWNDFLEGLNQREYSAYALSWLADYPDPQSFVDTLFRGNSPENHINYANPRVDALLEQAASEGDTARRAALYRDAQQLILDDAVVLPLYFATEYTLVKPYVKGLTITPMGILGLEQVWIER